MYGDSGQIRRRTDQLREQGADIRSLADRLVAQTEALGWTGRAAQAMQERVAERATHLRAAADRHVGAADALGDHAEAVDRIKDEIAERESRASVLVAEARTRLARIATENAGAGPGVELTADPDDELLGRFEPPPRGHKDWLTVELPGL